MRIPYSSHGCYVDKKGNLDSDIDEGVDEQEEAGTKTLDVVKHADGFPAKQA